MLLQDNETDSGHFEKEVDVSRSMLVPGDFVYLATEPHSRYHLDDEKEGRSSLSEGDDIRYGSTREGGKTMLKNGFSKKFFNKKTSRLIGNFHKKAKQFEDFKTNKVEKDVTQRNVSLIQHYLIYYTLCLD